MFRKSFALLIVAGCLFSVGCGDSHEKVARDSLAQLKRMVQVLESVKNADDAKKAKPKLEAIARNMKSIEVRMKKLGDPTPEVDKKLKAKYGKEVMELFPKMMQAMLTVPADAKKELGSAMDVIPKGFQ